MIKLMVRKMIKAQVPHVSPILCVYCRFEECRNMVVQYGKNDITPAVVARVLFMMARNPSSLPDPPSHQVTVYFCSNVAYLHCVGLQTFLIFELSLVIS